MRKTKSKPAKKQIQRQLLRQSDAPQKIPFIAHVHELRKRLFYTALSIGLGATLAYTVQKQLTYWLLKPAGNQQFIYTTPGGGFDFQVRLCLYTGIALAIPVILYQVFRYIHPLLKRESHRFVSWLIVSSSVAAVLGVAFGYFLGLPAAMHFLLQNFSTTRISALISIQSYMSFVMVYLLGSALLFQLPLILLFINRIKPLQPKKLIQHQRWFIMGAFIFGAILSPTPDVRNQLMLTGPIILMYEFSIFMIWYVNRRHQKPRKVVQLLNKDSELQSARLQSFQKAHAEWQKKIQAAGPAALEPQPSLTNATLPQTAQTASNQPTAVSNRTRKYVQDFTRRSVTLGRQTPQAE